MLHRKAVVLSLIILAALALSGCGEPPPPDHVAVGITFARQGMEISGGLDTLNLALEEYNARGIGPRAELALVEEGTEEDPFGFYDPEIERAGVQRAIDDPDVVLLVGGSVTDFLRVGIPMANRAGLAYIGGGGFWAGLTKPGYGPGEPGIYYPSGVRTFFRTCTRDDVFTRASVNFAIEHFGAETVYIVNDDVTSSSGVAGQFELAVQDAGLTLLAREEFDGDTLTPEEYTAMAERIVAANPDVLYYAGGGQRPILYEVRALSPDMPILGPEYTDVEVVTPPEGHDISELEGIIYFDPFPNASLFDNDAARSFIAHYEDTHGPLDQGLWGSQSTMLYEMMRVALYAIERAEEPTREGVLHSLQNLGTYSGVYGDWTFTPEGDMTVGFTVFYELRDGAWERIDFVTLEQD